MSPRKPTPAAFLLPFLALAATGCSSSKPPTFHIAGVQLREQNERGTELIFQIEASNPNGREVPLYEADYALLLNGQHVFQGVRTPEATLRRYGVQSFSLPVVVAADQMPAGTQIPYRFEGTITYVMPGALAEILFDRDLRRPKATLSDSGTLDLSTALAPASSDSTQANAAN